MTSQREPDISFSQYERAGGLKGAIDEDAEMVFGRFPDEKTAIERLFQRITEKGDGEKPIRKPDKMSVLAEIANLDLARMSKIVDAFAGRDLLVRRRLQEEEIQVDLPHECLAWKWERLRNWIDQEATIAKSLQFMSESAKKAQRLTGSALAEARQLREQRRLEGLWPTRYLSETELLEVRRWLDESEKWDREERLRLDRERRRAKRNFWISLSATIVMAGLTVLAAYFALRFREVGKMALARQLAAQSERVRKEFSYSLVPASLLAAESMERVPLIENDSALREAILLSPRHVASFANEFGLQGVALSRDGRYLATIPALDSFSYSTDEVAARVFEISDKKELWHSHQEGFFSESNWSQVALSQDGREVATASQYGKVCVYPLPNGPGSCGYAKGISDYSPGVADLAFSPDGKYLAAAVNHPVVGFGSVQLWTSELVPVWDRSERDFVRMIAFSPTGKLVAVGTGDSSVSIDVHDATNGREVSRLSTTDSVQNATFSPDDQYLVTGSANGTVTLFNVARRTVVYRQAGGGRVIAVSFTLNSLRCVSRVTDYVLHVFEGDRKISTITMESKVTSAALSPDGRYIAVGAGGYARIFEAASPEEAWHLQGGANTMHTALSPDGQYVAALNIENTNRTLSVYETRTGVKTWETTDGTLVGPLIFSPDGKSLASGSSSDTVRMFEAVTGRPVPGLVLTRDVSPLAFSVDGRLIFTGSSDDVRVFETANGKEVARLSCGGPVSKMAVSPDGNYVAVGSGNTVHVCSRAGGTEFWSSTEGGNLTGLAFSPDGQFLATGSVDTTARIFRVKTGEETSRQSFGAPVTALSFSRNLRYLFTASAPGDGSFKVQQQLYRPEDLIADACSRATRNLRVEEWNFYVGAEITYHSTCPNLP
jgi:WD40 repeat protein